MLREAADLHARLEGLSATERASLLTDASARWATQAYSLLAAAPPREPVATATS